MEMKKMWFFLTAALMCLASPAHASRYVSMCEEPGNDAIVKAVLFLTGAADESSLTEDEMERWWVLSESPVEINLAGRACLEASGLMTQYQVASLLDYRSRCGDILSVHELADVDGFGKESAEAMSMFISFVSRALPGKSSDYRSAVRNALSVNESGKVAIPFDGTGADTDWSWTLKYRADAPGRYDAGISLRRDYGVRTPLPSRGSGFATFYGWHHACRIIAGDYSLRFGQGMALWTGFSMAGVNSLESFWKRPSGISPSYSLSASSSMRGAALSLEFGKFALSAFSSFPGLRQWMEDGAALVPDMLHGANLSWYSRYGQVSATAYGMFGRACDHVEKRMLLVGKSWCIPFSKVSADARFCIRGVELFGETAFDICSLKPSASAGFVAPAGEQWKMALSGRYIPEEYGLAWCAPVRAWSGSKGESGASAGLSYSDKSLTVDWARQAETARQQVKVLIMCPFRISQTVSALMKFQGRWRSYGTAFCADVRGDIRWEYGAWQTNLRAEALYARSIAGLVYAEEGCQGRIGAFFLRGTMFIADSWDDRIYVYERDAPGSFNVPAYYGRGYALSAVARARFHFGGSYGEAKTSRHKASTLKTYLRAGFTDTPWLSPGQKKLRPAKAELKVQLMYDF